MSIKMALKKMKKKKDCFNAILYFNFLFIHFKSVKINKAYTYK